MAHRAQDAAPYLAAHLAGSSGEVSAAALKGAPRISQLLSRKVLDAFEQPGEHPRCAPRTKSLVVSGAAGVGGALGGVCEERECERV